jgi:hypothetical protein
MESFEGNLSVHEKNMYKDGGLERPAILLLFNQYVSERYLKGRILSKDLFEEKYQLE